MRSCSDRPRHVVGRSRRAISHLNGRTPSANQTLRLTYVLAAAIGLGTAIIIPALAGASGPNSQTTSTLSMSRPPQTVQTRLTDTQGGGLTLLPPPQSLQIPPISAQQALHLALTKQGVPSWPSGVSLTYGLARWGWKFRDVPAWLVSFQDVCVPLDGPNPGSCFVRPYNTLIDAQTGEWIGSFSDGWGVPEAES